MIARLWAQQIVDGNKTFSQVPTRLKEQVKEVLIKWNKQDLIVE
jgi:hypothetical protein